MTTDLTSGLSKSHVTTCILIILAVAALRLRAAEKLILLEEETSKLRHALTKL